MKVHMACVYKNMEKRYRNLGGSKVIEIENKQQYGYMFEGYAHSIPVNFSSLNGQYEGHLYVDKTVNPEYAVIFTPFDFIFVAGNPEAEDIVNQMDSLIWEYMLKYSKDEIIAFGPNEEWDNILEQVFARHHGVMDKRYCYKLNSDAFNKVLAQRRAVEGISFEVVYKQEQGSAYKYPVSIARDENGNEVGFCAAFMNGNGQVEIDVETQEAFRQRRIARENALKLVKHVIDHGYEPNWCCWPFREASQKLAESIGFKLEQLVKAHIWAKGMEEEMMK